MSSIEPLRKGSIGLAPHPLSAPGVSNQSPSTTSRILGRSIAIHRLLEQMGRATPHLRIGAVEGECGTGKSMVVRELHQRGPASNGPLVPLHASQFDLAVLPPAGGLLWLRHMDEMPADRQQLLLEFLRCRELSPSDATPIPLQVVVSSTRSLRALVGEGSLLADLAYRLIAVRFYLPPLRERHEDIPLLAQTFLDRFARKYHKPIQGLGTGALARLFSHGWPGNVRELHSVLESAVLQAEGQWIRPIDIVLTLPARPGQEALSTPCNHNNLSLETATRNHVATVMSLTGGNKKRAATLLGISRSTLYRMLGEEQSATP